MYYCQYTVELVHPSVGAAKFYSAGYTDREAVANLVSYLVGQRVGEGRLWWKADSEAENFSAHESRGARCMYVDASSFGVPFPVYILVPKVRLSDF